MAKKSAAVNKSQAIRDALAAHRNKPPREIAEILAGQGVKVSAQYVSIVKSNAKGKKRKTVTVRKPGKRGALGAVAAAIEFIRAAGGIQAAKDALAAVEEIKRLS